jgi:hypothetical protein
MKEAWENNDIGTKNVLHINIYQKTFFPEFLKFFKIRKFLKKFN